MADHGGRGVTDVLADSMSEAELQAHVMDMCRVLNLLVYHTHDSRRSPAGFPDLIITGRRVIARELKSAKGKTTPDQDRWLSALRYGGMDADVWRPADLRAGNVLRQLQGLRIGRPR